MVSKVECKEYFAKKTNETYLIKKKKTGTRKRIKTYKKTVTTPWAHEKNERI